MKERGRTVTRNNSEVLDELRKLAGDRVKGRIIAAQVLELDSSKSLWLKVLALCGMRGVRLIYEPCIKFSTCEAPCFAFR